MNRINGRDIEKIYRGNWDCTCTSVLHDDIKKQLVSTSCSLQFLMNFLFNLLLVNALYSALGVTAGTAVGL